MHKLSRVICELHYRDSRELLRQKFGVLVEPVIERGDPAARELKAEGCPDCDALRRHAYSDATTAGFFYTECERHRKL